MMPKSTGAIRPSAVTKALPGCMSAWKKPSRNTCKKKISADLTAIRRGSAGGGEAGGVVDTGADDAFGDETRWPLNAQSTACT